MPEIFEVDVVERPLAERYREADVDLHVHVRLLSSNGLPPVDLCAVAQGLVARYASNPDVAQATTRHRDSRKTGLAMKSGVNQAMLVRVTELSEDRERILSGSLDLPSEVRLRRIDDCPIGLVYASEVDISVAQREWVPGIDRPEVLISLQLDRVLNPFLAGFAGRGERGDGVIERRAEILDEVAKQQRPIRGRLPKNVKVTNPPSVAIEIGDDLIGLVLDEDSDTVIQSVQVLACSPVFRVGPLVPEHDS
ncbi:MAG TPA: hypothetical protein VF302_10420 [Candidatus Limnocylindrales bacterium]